MRERQFKEQQNKSTEDNLLDKTQAAAKAILAGHFTEQKDGGLAITGEKSLHAIRKILVEKAFEVKQPQKGENQKQRKLESQE